MWLLDTVPFARDAVVPILFAILYVVVGRALGFAGHGASGEIFGAAIAAFFGYIVSNRVRMRGFASGVRIIRDIADQSALSPGRNLYVQMILDRLREAKEIVEGFKRDTYRVSSPEQLQGWIGTFFELGEGDYVGVDSHTPSQYWSDYAWFLEAHARSLKQRRHHGVSDDDVRILAVDKGQLDDDWFDDEKRSDYRKFVKWHDDNSVELRTIATDQLSELRTEHDLQMGDDVALWIGFAVLFTGEQGDDEDEVTIKLRVKEDADLTPRYESLRGFMIDLRKRSHLMKDAPPGVEMGDADLVERWNDYVAPDLRWRSGGDYAHFIEDLTDPNLPVLDAAAGSGTDSVNLLERGFSVISNEVDPRLADQAHAFADRRGVALSLEVSRWEEFSLQGNLKFGTVLVLGNSLCLVSSAERRLQALQSFHRVLLPGGHLLIDERNFEYMRRNREAILGDPLTEWTCRVDDVMYPGKSLLGFPSEISDETVRWSFAANDPPVQSGSEMVERSETFHPLGLHAFHHGELHALLVTAGFEVQAVYGDFHRLEGEGAMPGYDVTQRAGFLTYLAVKVG